MAERGGAPPEHGAFLRASLGAAAAHRHPGAGAFRGGQRFFRGGGGQLGLAADTLSEFGAAHNIHPHRGRVQVLSPARFLLRWQQSGTCMRLFVGLHINFPPSALLLCQHYEYYCMLCENSTQLLTIYYLSSLFIHN